MDSVDERIAAIERRLAILEARTESRSAPTNEPPPLAKEPKAALLRVTVSNKRLDASNYESHIWFDCAYTLSSDSKSTRAVKGTIEFADLFGEVKFRLNVTINEPIGPGKSIAQPGIGFSFNEFMPDHQWMLGTALDHMKCSFRASNAIYNDGSSEAFA